MLSELVSFQLSLSVKLDNIEDQACAFSILSWSEMPVVFYNIIIDLSLFISLVTPYPKASLIRFIYLQYLSII